MHTFIAVTTGTIVGIVGITDLFTKNYVFAVIAFVELIIYLTWLIPSAIKIDKRKQIEYELRFMKLFLNYCIDYVKGEELIWHTQITERMFGKTE